MWGGAGRNWLETTVVSCRMCCSEQRSLLKKLGSTLGQALGATPRPPVSPVTQEMPLLHFALFRKHSESLLRYLCSLPHRPTPGLGLEPLSNLQHCRFNIRVWGYSPWSYVFQILLILSLYTYYTKGLIPPSNPTGASNSRLGLTFWAPA